MHLKFPIHLRMMCGCGGGEGVGKYQICYYHYETSTVVNFSTTPHTQSSTYLLYHSLTVCDSDFFSFLAFPFVTHSFSCCVCYKNHDLCRFNFLFIFLPIGLTLLLLYFLSVVAMFCPQTHKTLDTS